MTNVIFKSVIVCGLLAFPTTVGAQDTQSNVPLPPPGPYLSINNSLASPVMAAPAAQKSGDQKVTAQPVKDGEFPPANFDPQADGSQQKKTSDDKPKDEGVKKLLDANKVEQNKPVYAPQGTAKSLEEPKAATPTAGQNNTVAPQPNVNDYAPLPQFNAPTWGGNGNAAINDNSVNVQPAPSSNSANNNATNNQQFAPPVVPNPQPNVPQFSNNNGWQNNNRQNQQFNNGQNNYQNNRQNNGQNNNSYNRQNQQWGNQQFQQPNQNFQNGYNGNWQQQNRNFPNWNNNNSQGNRNQYQNNQQQQPQLAPRSSIIVKNKLFDLS